MSYISKRIQSLAPNFFASLQARINALEAGGEDVIRLDVGSPDMPPAQPIIDTLASSAANPDHHGYQPHKGTFALRNAWAGMYRRLYGVDLDPESEVLPLIGSKEGIFHLTAAFVDPGEVVLIPDPGYMTYTQAARFAGGVPFYMPSSAERDYLPELGAIPLYIAAQAKLIWLNYPNNPTAATASLDFLSEAVEFARQHHLLLCHDAAYAQVAFDGYQPPSLLQVPGASDIAVEFNTLSKSHNMAGWRVGAMLGSDRVLRALYKLKTQADSGHFRPVLDAAVVAMEGDQAWLEERNAIYARRRDLLVDGLRQLGLNPAVPRASLYVWCPVPSGWSAVDFTRSVLDEAHVSLTPGTVFGQGGEGYVRFAFTVPEERLTAALQRMVGLSALQSGSSIRIGQPARI